MSGAGAIFCGCCGCDGAPCEFCSDGTPLSLTITLAGITVSSNVLVLGAGAECWRFTTTSDANGTFCAEQDGGGEAPCEWSAGPLSAGIENAGEECEFGDVATSIAGITIVRISSTEFTITVSASNGSGDRFVLFYAVLESDVCYLDGASVENQAGAVADDESDGYAFQGGFAWTLGSGGTATITACCP